jgi:hypothetical protein
MCRGTQLTSTLAGMAGALALGACAVAPPAGPTVMALPGQGKTFAQFQQDDYICRAWSAQQTNFQQPGQAGTQAAVGSTVLGTAIGAAAGAAIGAAAGNPGLGAAAGGAAGLLGGSSVGANNAAASEFSLQQRYNIAYTQCMYGHGNSVQSPPPTGYAGFGAPAAYPYPAFWPGFYGPNVVIGFGGGWGWGWGWGGGWHGGWHH